MGISTDGRGRIPTGGGQGGYTFINNPSMVLYFIENTLFYIKWLVGWLWFNVTFSDISAI